MSARDTPGGLSLARRVDGEFLIQETTQSIALSDAFENLTRAVRATTELAPGPKGLLSLVVNDAVLRQDDLRAIAADGKIWTDGTRVAIEWPRRHGWKDRRYLSVETSLVLSVQVGALGSTRNWQAATRFLQKHLPNARKHPWAVLSDAAHAWWHGQLPGPLFAHCAGLQPLQPLDRAAHARRATGKPLAPIRTDDAAHLLSELTDRIDEIAAATNLTHTAQAIVRAVREGAAQHRDEVAVRAKMVERLLDQFTVATQHGRAQAIIVAGTLSVISEGGVLGRLLKPRTLASYISHCVEPLLSALLDAAQDVYEMSGAERWSLYQGVVAKAPLSAREQVGAFLSAIDRYLVATGCPPLPTSISKPVPAAPPYARTLWDAELALACALVEQSDSGARVLEQALVVLAIASSVAIRTSEIWSLLVGHIQEVDGGCVLHIHPMRRHGGAKTPSARRDVLVFQAAAARRLIEWKARRVVEGAQPSDLLFGDPHHLGKLSEQAATMQVVSSVLKQATGDPSASLYALRHAVISRLANEAAGPTKAEDDAIAFANVSAIAGHACFGSSRAYWNDFEQALAACCRDALPSKAGDIASILDRFPRLEDGIAMNELPTLLQVPVCRGSSWGRPALGPRVVAAVLTDLAHGREPAGAALRSNLDEPQVFNIINATAQALSQHRLDTEQRFNDVQWATVANIQRLATWMQASSRAKFAPLWQEIDRAEEEGQLLDRLAAVVASWSRCRHRDDLSLDRLSAARPVVAFVDNCMPMSPTRLVTYTEQSRAEVVNELKRGRWAIRLVASRRGRAHTRLHICGEPVDANPSGAALGMQGLHAIFLVVDVALRLAHHPGR